MKLYLFIKEKEFENTLRQNRVFRGDYLVISRGMIYKMDFKDSDNRHLVIESAHPVYTPKKYRNWFGQLLEHSPYCERDLRVPNDLETYDEKGEFLIKIKKEGFLYDYIYGSHPLMWLVGMATIILCIFHTRF